MLQRPARPVLRQGMSSRPSTRLPKLVAFDLDDTLWSPEMWLIRGPPFRAHKNIGSVIDSAGERISLIGHSLNILQQLSVDPQWKNSQAYVSRTEYPEYAIPCMKTLQILPGVSMFDLSSHNEIFPGRKTEHFRNIHKRTGIAYSDMIFFDNEYRNIVDCQPLGITCVFTPDGMTEGTWTEGLKKHADRYDQETDL